MIGEAKFFFNFDDFDHQCLDVSMVVTNVIIILRVSLLSILTEYFLFFAVLHS